MKRSAFCSNGNSTIFLRKVFLEASELTFESLGHTINFIKKAKHLCENGKLKTWLDQNDKAFLWTNEKLFLNGDRLGTTSIWTGSERSVDKFKSVTSSNFQSIFLISDTMQRIWLMKMEVRSKCPSWKRDCQTIISFLVKLSFKFIFSRKYHIIYMKHIICDAANSTLNLNELWISCYWVSVSAIDRNIQHLSILHLCEITCTFDSTSPVL